MADAYAYGSSKLTSSHVCIGDVVEYRGQLAVVLRRNGGSKSSPCVAIEMVDSSEKRYPSVKSLTLVQRKSDEREATETAKQTQQTQQVAYIEVSSASTSEDAELQSEAESILEIEPLKQSSESLSFVRRIATLDIRSNVESSSDEMSQSIPTYHSTNQTNAANEIPIATTIDEIESFVRTFIERELDDESSEYSAIVSFIISMESQRTKDLYIEIKQRFNLNDEQLLKLLRIEQLIHIPTVKRWCSKKRQNSPKSVQVLKRRFINLFLIRCSTIESFVIKTRPSDYVRLQIVKQLFHLIAKLSKRKLIEQFSIHSLFVFPSRRDLIYDYLQSQSDSNSSEFETEASHSIESSSGISSNCAAILQHDHSSNERTLNQSIACFIDFLFNEQTLSYHYRDRVQFIREEMKDLRDRLRRSNSSKNEIERLYSDHIVFHSNESRLSLIKDLVLTMKLDKSRQEIENELKANGQLFENANGWKTGKFPQGVLNHSNNYNSNLVVDFLRAVRNFHEHFHEIYQSKDRKLIMLQYYNCFPQCLKIRFADSDSFKDWNWNEQIDVPFDRINPLKFADVYLNYFVGFVAPKLMLALSKLHIRY